MLKAYALRSQTKDGFAILLGGLCPARWRDRIVQQLLGIRHLTFGAYCDPYEIDYHFVQLLKSLQIGLNNIPYVLAGVIAIPDAIDCCGAVLGVPSNPCSSADEDENPLLLLDKPEIYSVCYPGKMGMAFSASYQKACQITNSLHHMASIPLAASPKEAADLIGKITNLYVICSDIRPDRDGGWTGGTMIVSDADGEKELFL